MSSTSTGRDVHSLMLSIQHFQGALKGGFRQAVVACDVPGPRKFPFPDSCQKRFLWTHKEVDHAPHPVVELYCVVLYRKTVLCNLCVSNF